MPVCSPESFDLGRAGSPTDARHPAPAPAHDDRIGRWLEAAMRVLGGVVVLCLAAAWLMPWVLDERWPAPPPHPHPVHLRLDDPGLTPDAVIAARRAR